MNVNKAITLTFLTFGLFYVASPVCVLASISIAAAFEVEIISLIILLLPFFFISYLNTLLLKEYKKENLPISLNIITHLLAFISVLIILWYYYCSLPPVIGNGLKAWGENFGRGIAIIASTFYLVFNGLSIYLSVFGYLYSSRKNVPVVIKECNIFVKILWLLLTIIINAIPSALIFPSIRIIMLLILLFDSIIIFLHGVVFLKTFQIRKIPIFLYPLLFAIGYFLGLAIIYFYCYVTQSQNYLTTKIVAISFAVFLAATLLSLLKHYLDCRTKKHKVHENESETINTSEN